MRRDIPTSKTFREGSQNISWCKTLFFTKRLSGNYGRLTVTVPFCLDDSVQHPVGPAVPVPEPGPYRCPAARTGRVPGGGQVSLCRRSLARREQAQDVPAGL